MSDEKRFFEEITQKTIAENGVVSLAIRPNQKSQYGTGGLSGKELQQRFDKLATLIIARYNEMAKALSSEDVLEYFKLPKGTTLADFIQKITDDDYDIVSKNPYDKGNEAKLSTIIQKLFTGIEALATFTEYDETKAQKLSQIYATIAALQNETRARQSSDAELATRISNAIQSLTTAISTAVTEHNNTANNHEDIRRDLATVLAFLSPDSGNDTIDRLHELIAEIEKNAGSIDEITKNKVSKDDIVNTFSDLESATNSNIPGAKLLYDYFATKEALTDLITSTALTEALTTALLPYAKNIRLGGSLKYFITTYQHTQSDINGWMDKTDTWSIPNDQSVEGVESGDRLLFRCFNTTTNLYSYVFATAVEIYPDTNKIMALSTSVIHAGASTSSGGIDASSIVTNLDDPSTDKVLAASVGALIKERIAEAVKGLLSEDELTKALEGLATKGDLEGMLTEGDLNAALEDVATKEEIQGLVKSTDLDKTLANYALTTEVHTIAKDKIQEALETFDPGFNLPEAATDIFAEAFLTNGSFALQYDLYDEEAACSGIGNCTASALEIGSLAKGLPVKSVTIDAFNGTGITSAILPETVGDIDKFAFANCANLVCITLPKKMSDIYKAAFLNCANLRSIVYNGEIYDWNKITIDADNDALTFATLYCLPEGVDVETNANGKSCTVKNIHFDAEDHADINIPAVIDTYTVVAITRNPRTNNYTRLTGLWLPDGVKSIEGYTFSECNLMKTVRLPKALKTVGDSAFRNCTALTDIYYQGSEDEWNAIQFGSKWNDGVTATIHYNYGG